MLKISEKEVLTKVIDDVVCNKCGNSCKGESNFNGLVEAVVTGGYDSEHLEDMCSYSFSLCEKCLIELFNAFLIKPEISGGY